jgi:SulP family sulfate permease
MIAAILLFADLVGYIAMPALAGLLIVVGVKTFKPDDVRMVLRTGPVQATVMLTTFVLTMIIPLQYAVLIGVGLSVILYVARQSNRIQVKQWVFSPDGTVTEQDPPPELPANQTVVLRPYGSLFFAAAPAFDAALPAVTDRTRHATVIVTLRGKEDLGSTFINVITRYAQRLQQADSTLMLAGVSDRVADQLTNTGADAVLGPANIYRATPAITESTQRAIAAAHKQDRTTQPDAGADQPTASG